MAIDASLRVPEAHAPIMGIRKVRIDRTPIAVAVLESTPAAFTIECRTRSAGWEEATFSKARGRISCSNGTWNRALTLEALRELVAGLAPSEWPELLRSFNDVEAFADEAWSTATALV